MIIKQQVQELGLVHRALEEELAKVQRGGAEVKVGFTEGEYDLADLWGRLTSLGQLVSGLEGVEVGSVQTEGRFVAAVRAGWECFWELDKLLSGRGLRMAERQVMLDRISGVASSLNVDGAGETMMDLYVAHLAE